MSQHCMYFGFSLFTAETQTRKSRLPWSRAGDTSSNHIDNFETCLCSSNRSFITLHCIPARAVDWNPPEPAVSCGYWKLERVLASEQPQTRDHGTDCLFWTAQLVTQIYTPLLVGKWCLRSVISVGTPLINRGSNFWSRNLHIFHQTPSCFDDFENFWKSFKHKHENIFETRDQFRSIALLKVGIEYEFRKLHTFWEWGAPHSQGSVYRILGPL